MNKIKQFFEWFKQTWAYKPTLILIILILVMVVMDKLIMPFVVDLGDERELPDVIEMTLDQAKNVLEKEGFNVIVKDSLFDANHPLGTVIEQSPYPYATVKEGRRVYLTISIGDKPIIMPKLIGASPRDAELTIKSYNLIMGNKSYMPSDIYLEGTVIGQSYPQGQQIKPNTRINITISLGKLKEEKTVPSLVGKSLYEAKQSLKMNKLKIGEITYEERDKILPETVLKQSLEAGNKVQPEDVIDLVISKEKIEE
jgi:eukaryotic-like serine/threonine-protein kinase